MSGKGTGAQVQVKAWSERRLRNDKSQESTIPNLQLDTVIQFFLQAHI